jgi:hypothetical protein
MKRHKVTCFLTAVRINRLPNGGNDLKLSQTGELLNFSAACPSKSYVENFTYLILFDL